jgi:hypothetical protein
MAEQKRFIIEVEKAKEATEDRPSRGPAYRSIFAKDGFPAPIQGLDSCWDVFRLVYHTLFLLISMHRYEYSQFISSRFHSYFSSTFK